MITSQHDTYDLTEYTVDEVLKIIGKKIFNENPDLSYKELMNKIYKHCLEARFLTQDSYSIYEDRVQKVLNKLNNLQEQYHVSMNTQFEVEKQHVSMPTFTLTQIICPKHPGNIKDIFYRLFDASWLPRKNPFNHKTDVNKFIKATLKLFPNTNAYSFGNTLTVFRKFIENIYYNLGYKGLKAQQVAMYQFSAVGGTGKSEFNKRMRHFLTKMDIDFVNSAPKGRWVSADYSRSLVAICDEWTPPKGQEIGETIGKINNVIDNVDYQIEYKYQDSCTARSVCSLIFNSNYLPFDDNDRRYGVIEYNEKMFSHISEEDKVKYFPERTEEEWDNILLEAFESCPFGKCWEDNRVRNSEDFDGLIDFARTVVNECMVVNNQYATIGEVSRAYYNLCGGDKAEIKRFVRKAIRKAVAEDKVKVVRRINGDVDYSKYNWVEIANLPTSEDEIRSPLSDIDNIFEKTVFAAKSFLEPETTPPTDNGSKTKLSDGNLFVDKFTTEDSEGNTITAFTRCKTENKMQEYVVVNKPLPCNDGTSRKNCDVEQNCFLLEIDGDKKDCPEFDEIHKNDGIQWKGSLEEKEFADKAINQYMKPFIETNKKYLKWVCSSGRLSVHAVLKTNLPKDEVNSELRTFIFDKINEKWFGGRLDKQCKNAGRLGRNPNAIRKGNGNLQLAKFINEDCEALDVSEWVLEFNAIAAKIENERKNWVPYTGKVSKEGLEKQFETMVNHTGNPSGLLALRLLNKEPVESGENLIGAIGYCRTLKDYDSKWIPVYEAVRDEAHKQHPTNIGLNTK